MKEEYKKIFRLADFIDNYFDNKASRCIIINASGTHFFLFESHFVKVFLNDKMITAQIDLGNNEILTSWEGKPFTSSTDEQAIKECLSRVEACSRAHLLPKFLIAKGWQKGETKITLRNKDHIAWKEKHHKEMEKKKMEYLKLRSTPEYNGYVTRWSEQFVKAAKTYFGSRISDMKINGKTENGPDTGMMHANNGFSFQYRIYDYFDIYGFGAELGFGFNIIFGKNENDKLLYIEIPTAQGDVPFYELDFEELFKDMEEEIELRIPDEYLAAKSWEKKQPPTDEGKNAQKSENVAYFDLDD